MGKEAIDKDLSGILENQTWKTDDVVPREGFMRRKEPICMLAD